MNVAFLYQWEHDMTFHTSLMLANHYIKTKLIKYIKNQIEKKWQNVWQKALRVNFTFS